MTERTTKPKEALVSSVIEQIKRRTAVLVLIFMGSVIIAIATFTDATNKFWETASSSTDS